MTSQRRPLLPPPPPSSSSSSFHLYSFSFVRSTQNYFRNAMTLVDGLAELNERPYLATLRSRAWSSQSTEK
ncbi:unnamed protein product [Sympodiomycopsis kandeliae]